MEYTIQNLRILVMDCMEGHKESKELGDFAYDAWFYYSDGEGEKIKAEREFLDFLLEISSEWGFIQENEEDSKKFQKEYLQNLLSRIEHFMNVDTEDRGF